MRQVTRRSCKSMNHAAMRLGKLSKTSPPRVGTPPRFIGSSVPTAVTFKNQATTMVGTLPSWIMTVSTAPRTKRPRWQVDAQDPDDLGIYSQEPGDQMLHTQEPGGHGGPCFSAMHQSCETRTCWADNAPTLRTRAVIGAMHQGCDM